MTPKLDFNEPWTLRLTILQLIQTIVLIGAGWVAWDHLKASLHQGQSTAEGTGAAVARLEQESSRWGAMIANVERAQVRQAQTVASLRTEMGRQRREMIAMSSRLPERHAEDLANQWPQPPIYGRPETGRGGP